MKKLTLAMMVVVLLIGAVPTVFTTAQNDITITYNGIEIQFYQPPIIQNDRVLASLDTIVKELDLEIYWGDGEQSNCFCIGAYYFEIDSPYIDSPYWKV